MVRSLLLALFACAALFASAASVDDRGWGSQIEWVKLDDAKKRAAVENKPIMLLVWKSWCGSCKQLRPKFAADADIAAVSKDLLMVQVADDEEPTDEMFRPDGGYIPRILFMDPQGSVMTDLTNQAGNPSYKYYYPATPEIASSMRKPVARVGGKGEL
jgi:protein-disulfide reductase (glutathione)